MNRYQELLESARRGERDIAPVTRLLGIRLTAWAPGSAELEMEAGEAHHNPHGVVHGGILCDLADAACGCAVASAVDSEQAFTTLDLNITFFRPVLAGRLTAQARVVRMGKRTCYASDGQATAKVTSTLMLLARESA